LLARHGLLSKVTLITGEALDVWDVTYGRDLGDTFDHLTANIRPQHDHRPIHFFFTSEVASIADTDGEVLFTAAPTH